MPDIAPHRLNLKCKKKQFYLESNRNGDWKHEQLDIYTNTRISASQERQMYAALAHGVLEHYYRITLVEASPERPEPGQIIRKRERSATIGESSVGKKEEEEK